MISKLALALALTLGTAGSAAATTIDFEGTAEGTYSELIYGDVTISFLGGDGAFQVDEATPGPPVSGHSLISYFVNPGDSAFQAIFAGGASSVSIGMGDFNSDDDEGHLRAYDSANNLLDVDFVLVAAPVFGGATMTVSSATSIARVEWNETGTFAGAVYWDNLTYTAFDAVPEPSTWAMMLLGFAAVGAGFRRRQSALA
jgi:hypothetical protein